MTSVSIEFFRQAAKNCMRAVCAANWSLSASCVIWRTAVLSKPVPARKYPATVPSGLETIGEGKPGVPVDVGVATGTAEVAVEGAAEVTTAGFSRALSLFAALQNLL